MRKVRETLRLRFGLGLLPSQIARSCSIGQATVHRHLQKAAAAGLSWPLPEDIDDRRQASLEIIADFGSVTCNGPALRFVKGDKEPP